MEAPDPETVVITTKYKWAPLVADIALFNNAVLPKDYAGMTQKQFYEQPIGTGPFKWDHWTHGQEIELVKNPDYWQKGKPYLDSVTWTTVPTGRHPRAAAEGRPGPDRRVPGLLLDPGSCRTRRVL